ncbi:hypothetical protein [Roseibium aggregatum]|uniref:Uncharacterized protein n=2 Tax=Roseibium TaxID=150830 RepID=A0A0M6Y3A9_9HYPH|nr:hypothetical protein [Roseibium aggregatum]CTQ44575.1 hypothetical protein LAL4801_03020 [Roseibium aggregatum]
MTRLSRSACFGFLAFTWLGGTAAVEPAMAQAGRPDTRSMTCAQAQELVRKSGSIVLTTGQSTFDRFVANGSYCRPQTGQVRAKFAPTRDNPQCSVGYRCFQNRTQR